MIKTAEFVSLGHPDKTADYISSSILDYLIERDPDVKFAVEVMIKDNTVVLGGEIRTDVPLPDTLLTDLVVDALHQIGYTEEYAERWGEHAINPDKIKVINLLGKQSGDIHQGVCQNGWGDQGVFVGYACKGDGQINRELFLARKLCHALYHKALGSDNLGLDIKTQITLNVFGHVDTAVVAIPMLEQEDLTIFIVHTLGCIPNKLIVNGTGTYKMHSSIADCGITGRKLACDFYSTACPIGGGSPWTKDPSKADLTLNIYARQLAIEHLADNDECFVYLSACIGHSQLPSAVVKTIKAGKEITDLLDMQADPKFLINHFGLNKPIYTKLCRVGLV